MSSYLELHENEDDEKNDAKNECGNYVGSRPAFDVPSGQGIHEQNQSR
jgi:hypothetical protein